MANIRVKVKIDHPRMQAIVGKMSKEAVQRGAEATRRRYVENIGASGRSDSGAMAQEVTTKDLPSSDPYRPGVAVGTPVPYAKYQEFGTRAHGPVRAKFLRFKPKGKNFFVFAKWVRGITPAKFAKKTLDQIRPSDFLP